MSKMICYTPYVEKASGPNIWGIPYYEGYKLMTAVPGGE